MFFVLTIRVIGICRSIALPRAPGACAVLLTINLSTVIPTARYLSLGPSPSFSTSIYIVYIGWVGVGLKKTM